MTASRVRWIALALGYAVFLSWYGGNGTPLSSAEVDSYVERAAKRDPEFAERLRTLASGDDGREFVMVNLNQYRERAAYADGRVADATPEEIETRYTSKMAVRLLVRACHPLVAVRPFLHLGSGEVERVDWDRATLVRYRSRRDFLEVIMAAIYAGDLDHKWAALERAHSFPSTPLLSFATLRLVPLLFLVVVGLLADRFLAPSR